MPTKYKKAISEIKISDELKEKIKANMEQLYQKEYKSRGLIFKIKKTIITILTTIVALATLVCGGGIAYAKLGGTINSKPVLEWFGQIIHFSDNYSDYIESVNNQFIENDNMKLKLVNTISDDGFIVFNFDLKLKEEFENKIKQEIGITDSEFLVSDISFNDVYKFDEIYKKEVWENLGTSKCKIIIDGEEFYRTNLLSNNIKYSKETGTYNISQIYFLTEDEIKGKEEFAITLNNPVIAMPKGKFEVIDGKFDIQTSKTKTISNSEIINTDNVNIKYGDNFEQKIEKIALTPLNDIIKITSITLEHNYNGNIGGTPNFVIYNNDKKIDPININIGKTIYEDGKSVLIGEEFDDSHYFDPYRTKVIDNMYDLDYDNDIIEVKERIDTNYIILDKNEEKNNLKIEVYIASSYEENNEPLDDTILLCNYYVDLKNKTISSEMKNEKQTKEKVYELFDVKNNEGKVNKFDEQMLKYYRNENIEVKELSVDDLKILGISIGMNKSDVKKILGNNYKIEHKDAEYMIYEDLGVSFGIDNELVQKIIYGYNLNYINANKLAMRNIKLSSTIKEVVNAFNEKNILYYDKEQGYDKELGKSSILVVGYEGTDVFGKSEKPKIIFRFLNNIVTSITLTKYDM